jgi:hypothetical protein
LERFLEPTGVDDISSSEEGKNSIPLLTIDNVEKNPEQWKRWERWVLTSLRRGKDQSLLS